MALSAPHEGLATVKSLIGVVRSKQLWVTVLALLAVAGVLTAASGVAPQIALPRLNVFSDADTARAIVQVVLLAQAPLMAISLAVMVFIVGGVQRRDDLDDPLYEWFLARAFVIPVFFATIVLSLATAAAFFLSRTGSAGDVANLAVFSGASLGAAVLILLAFVIRALHVLRPGQYRQYKRDATIHQVVAAARSYLSYTASPDRDEVRSKNWTTPSVSPRIEQWGGSSTTLSVRFELADLQTFRTASRHSTKQRTPWSRRAYLILDRRRARLTGMTSSTGR